MIIIDIQKHKNLYWKQKYTSHKRIYSLKNLSTKWDRNTSVFYKETKLESGNRAFTKYISAYLQIYIYREIKICLSGVCG